LEKSLVVENLERLILTKGYFQLVIVKKYIEPQSIEAWIRIPVKRHLNGSIFWKTLVSSFPLVGSFLWWIGNGRKVKLGLVPWIGRKGMQLI
jgi:hypothetical protein